MVITPARRILLFRGQEIVILPNDALYKLKLHLMTEPWPQIA